MGNVQEPQEKQAGGSQGGEEKGARRALEEGGDAAHPRGTNSGSALVRHSIQPV